MLRKEAGQVLPMALLLMLLGGLLIIPTLNFATTNLKATQSVNQHTRELYAADAGINNALWYLQSDNRTRIINPTLQWPTSGITYWPSDNETSGKINSKDVQVNISTPWLLKSLPGYPDTQPTSGVAGWTLISALNISDNSTYVIQVSTTADASTLLDNISVWMPQGYSIESLTANVQINGVKIGGPGTNYQYVKDYTSKQSWRGGTIYKWSYLGRTFKDLSDIAPPPPGGGLIPADKYPPSIQLSFKYTVTPFKQANGFFPWIQLGDQSIAWDSSAGFFHIRSTSITAPTDNTTIEAYVPRGLPRYTGGTASASAVQGDYIAIGNSLMTACWHQGGSHGHPTYTAGPPCDYACTGTNCLGKKYTESSATINADFGPEDAKIEKAYLYWTAWQSTDNTDTQATLKVNGTLVGTNGTVTADKYFHMTCSPGYQYACCADVTDNVTAITNTLRNTVFTVGGVNATPATTCDSSAENQYSNAGWSMIIIYSSLDPAVGVHQIYVYDNMFYLWGSGSTVSATFTISGFKAPDTNIDAEVGYFVAEGDPQYNSDYFEFKGQQSALWYSLGDLTSPNPWNNVYNSFSTSTGFTPSTNPPDYYGGATGIIGGVDLDIYNKDKNGLSLSGIVQPGDTQAQIRVRTTMDAIRVIYTVFSVTSTAITPGEEFNIGSMLYTVQ
jgi:hypothetical protein